MKKNRVYCSYCGEKITSREIDEKVRDYCANCNTVYYENPLPVASAIVLNNDREVLLVKRARDPYKDMWCLPIGFAETGEEVRDAALRELKEEAGIDGEIVRLIDVDTVDNYFYGSLAIVTYEIRKTGGEEHPGDDASDAAYFPIHDLPPLAWASNEKAVSIYLDLYRDTWSMVDSFSHLFPETDMLQELTDQHSFLSDILIQVIDMHIADIEKKWETDLRKSFPEFLSYIEVLRDLNRKTLRGIQFWLKRKKGTLGVEEFIESGMALKEKQVPLPEIINIMALSRGALWSFIAEQGILSSPLKIYTALEMNNRIIFFYDRIIYYITRGYCI